MYYVNGPPAIIKVVVNEHIVSSLGKYQWIFVVVPLEQLPKSLIFTHNLIPASSMFLYTVLRNK